MPRRLVVLAALALCGAGGCLYTERGVGGPYTVAELWTPHERGLMAGMWIGIDVSVHLSDAGSTPLSGKSVVLWVQDGQGQDVTPAQLQAQPAVTDSSGKASAVVIVPTTPGAFTVGGTLKQDGLPDIELTALALDAVADWALTVVFREDHLDAGSPVAAVAGPLDASGTPFLVVATVADATHPSPGLSVWRAGGLADPAWTVDLASRPSALVLGDFKGDAHLTIGVAQTPTLGGHVDLFGLTKDQKGEVTGVRLRDGIDLTARPSALAAPYLDAQGHSQLVVAEPTNSQGPLEVFDLTDATLDGSAGLSPASALAVGRFDADAIDDLVAAGAGSSAVTVYLGGKVLPQTDATASFDAGDPVTAVCFGDVDADGLTDVAAGVSTGTTTGALVLALQVAGSGGGIPGFTVQAPITLGGVPLAVLAADLNGDGAQDLVVLTRTPVAGQLEIFVRTNAGLVAVAPIPLAGSPATLAAADLDHDGRLDLVVASHGQPLTLLFGR